MSELADRLHRVDPDLNIISPHRHHKRKEKRELNLQDWEKAEGKVCPKCGQTDVRFIKGVCRNCYKREKENLAKVEASFRPLIYGKDRKLASRIQKMFSESEQ